MSVKLYIAKIPEQLDCSVISRLSEHRRNKLSSVRNEKGIKQSVAGELLLEKAVEGVYSRPLPIETGEKGKPYLAENKCYFNISHSDEYVACAVADFELGLDIQSEVICNLKLAERFFSKDEFEYLKTDNSAFTMLWTKKESRLKALGLGLSGGLSNFSVLENEHEYYYNRIDDLHISVCVPNAKSVEVDMFEIKLL